MCAQPRSTDLLEISHYVLFNVFSSIYVLIIPFYEKVMNNSVPYSSDEQLKCNSLNVLLKAFNP